MNPEKLTDVTVIRKTKSRCVECGKIVDASVLQRQGKIFLEKKCPVHGDMRVLLSECPQYYKKLDSYFFSVTPDELKRWAMEIDITFRCNMKCPICAWGNDFRQKMSQFPEPTIEEIVNFSKKNKIKTVRLSGGEPTCRDDLVDIVRALKAINKRVIINTNGVKLHDYDYVSNLYDAGVDTINVTFDGFSRETEVFLRGDDYLPYKLKALDNLKTMRIPTGLNIRIMKGMNENQISKIIDYAVANDHIKLLSFGTVGWVGNARNWPDDKYFMPDQLIDAITQQTGNQIRRESFYLFQKLFIAVGSFFNQRWCFYDSASIMLLKEKGTYETVDKYIDLRKIERYLDSYVRLYKRNIFMAKLYLFFAGILSIRHIRSTRLLKELMGKGLSFFKKNNRYLKTNSFIYLNVSTTCDNHKIDYKITRNCIFGMVFKGKDGILRFRGTGADMCDALNNGPLPL
ncbi:MAG: radical SAM protein [Candidatus Omnitrophica bacterium]|nr:radical SAM protein [Candidatus Omnitrophota bacterium]